MRSRRFAHLDEAVGLCWVPKSSGMEQTTSGLLDALSLASKVTSDLHLSWNSHRNEVAEPRPAPGVSLVEAAFPVACWRSGFGFLEKLLAHQQLSCPRSEANRPGLDLHTRCFLMEQDDHEKLASPINTSKSQSALACF